MKSQENKKSLQKANIFLLHLLYIPSCTLYIRTTKRLESPPQTPEEYYIATGGIIPNCKR